MAVEYEGGTARAAQTSVVFAHPHDERLHQILLARNLMG